MEKYFPRFLEIPEHTCFIFGPRGTGKSTFLQHHLPDALRIDLLQPEQFRNFKARPEAAGVVNSRQSAISEYHH
jgi:hypothetical protein